MTSVQSGLCATICSVTEPTIFSFVVTRSSRDMPGERGRPAVMTTTSEPAVSSYEFVPVIRGSKPSTGPIWFRSSALPRGSPSLMSVRARSACLQFLDARARDLARAYGRRVLAVRFHVVRDAPPLRDDGGDRPFEAVGRAALVQVAEHEDARQHLRNRVDLVHPGVLRRGAV